MTPPRITTNYPGVSYREAAEGGRRYIVQYRDSNGAQRSKTLPLGATLQDALALQGELRHRRSRGESLVRCTKSVGELLDMYLETRRPALKPATCEVYEWAIEKHLKPTFGTRKLVDLSPSEVAHLIAKLKKDGRKTWTVKKILAPLSGAYQIAVREGWVASSPLSKLLPHERPKSDQREMRCLSRTEIQSLLSSTESLRWRALFALLIFSGLRIGEALSLTWLDLKNETIKVNQSKTKAGEREVILIPAVRSLLAALKLKQAPGATYVFGTRENAPCGRREALRALRVAEDKAGIPAYTLHELRHTFASILIAQGELPTLVAKQMGHADPSVTLKVYSHLWEEQESVAGARERLQKSMGGVF